MKKLLILPVFIALIFSTSCSSDNCECTKRSFNYDGDYPVSTLEEVDCPGDIEDGEDIIVWREDDKIDYVLSKTCI